MGVQRPLLLVLLLSVAGIASTDNTPPTDAPIKILKNAEVYAPFPLGPTHVMVAGGAVVALTPAGGGGAADPAVIAGMLNPRGSSHLLVEVIDASGLIATPGLIDPHMHVAGGGGELGPASRTPWAQVGQIVDGGITTAVGLLGTDGITRSLENLLQMLLGLEQSGLTTHMLTGSYHTPLKTLMGSVERDVTLIEKIIGIGEVAISDHRSSWSSYQELVQIVSDARVAGMLSGTAGVSLFHVGDGPTMLNPLWEIVNKTTIPITQMYPTHMSSRGQRLIDEGIKWIAAGGVLDFTADGPGENDTISALEYYRQLGVDLSHVTLSSDAYGSFPEFDANGVLVSYGVGMPVNVLNDLRTLVLEQKWSVDAAFSLATNNTAKVLSLHSKGTLEVGKDADILLLEPSTLELKYVFAKGKPLKTPHYTAQGMFPCN